MTVTVHRIDRLPKALLGKDHHERLTIAAFAERVHRSPKTIYKWIRMRQMPPLSVVRVQGHLEIDWTVYSESIQPVT